MMNPSLGFLNLGREYLNAAFSVQDPKRCDWLADHGSFPAYFLLGHAIELFLKSFLLAKGMSESVLRKKTFGHDLNKILKEAQSRNLEDELHLSTDDLEVIALFSEDYRCKLLEYHQVGLYTPPKYRMLAELAQKICDGLQPIAKRTTHGEYLKNRKKA